MGREPVTEELLGVHITSTPLPFPKSQELLPDVMQIVSVLGANLASMLKGGLKGTDDFSKLIPVLGAFAQQIGGGKLQWLTPKLLASTYAVLEVNGDKAKFDLSKEDERNDFFDERPDLYLVTLFMAGRVTFGRFFPARGRGGGATTGQ